jgi:hypothetical protein
LAFTKKPVHLVCSTFLASERTEVRIGYAVFPRHERVVAGRAVTSATNASLDGILDKLATIAFQPFSHRTSHNSGPSVWVLVD